MRLSFGSSTKIAADYYALNKIAVDAINVQLSTES